MFISDSAVAAEPAPDTDAWLADFLKTPATESNSADRRNISGPDDLKNVSILDLIGAVERQGETPCGETTIALYQSWIASQSSGSGHLHAAWFNLGVAYSQAKDQPNAIAAYRNALRLRPDFHAAAINLGNVLESLGETDAALQVWQQALQPKDAQLMLINNRARLLEHTGRLGEAEQEMWRSLLIDAQQPDVIQQRMHLRQKICAWPILADDVPGLGEDALLRHAGPMTTLAMTDDPQLQLQAGQDWIARKTSSVPLALSPPDGYRHDRIRLGYLSSDFCSHAMSYLIAELFERHDRSRFVVYGYCSSPEDGSPVRARVMGSFDHFKRIKDLSDSQAARLIREDEIDILIDLNGLTSGIRPQILRARAAPVQATYLGFVGPVPLPELDYLFCDQIVVPPDAASSYHPAPLYIGKNYQANDSKRPIGQATTRAAAGLPEDKFVYCCFSNHYKVTPAMFAAWMDILRRSDNAIIWLVSDNQWARANIVKCAAEHGIAAERIVFAPRVGPDDYMARLSLADVFLDTFPYNAGTVASDAIRMGLPLVTLSGKAFASRMAASLLTAIGAAPGITTSLQDYIDFAVSLAANRQHYDVYKGNFTLENWRRSIGNTETFVASYEGALLSIAKPGRPVVAR